MTLPIFEPGSTMIAEERWHDLLWSAVPQRVLRSSSSELISYLPTGTAATFATNRGLPEAEGLDREQRKLLAMKTCRVVVAERAEAPDKLFIYRPGRWARINLGWDSPTGRFLGWYVNFELPPETTPLGVVSKDLVLDMWVDADRSWRWKDRDDFYRALADDILDPAVRAPIEAEAELVLQELKDCSGPFTDEWTDFRADPAWEFPELPAQYALGGAQWELPVGDRPARLPDVPVSTARRRLQELSTDSNMGS